MYGGRGPLSILKICPSSIQKAAPCAGKLKLCAAVRTCPLLPPVFFLRGTQYTKDPWKPYKNIYSFERKNVLQ